MPCVQCALVEGQGQVPLVLELVRVNPELEKKPKAVLDLTALVQLEGPGAVLRFVHRGSITEPEILSAPSEAERCLLNGLHADSSYHLQFGENALSAELPHVGKVEAQTKSGQWTKKQQCVIRRVAENGTEQDPALYSWFDLALQLTEEPGTSNNCHAVRVRFATTHNVTATFGQTVVVVEGPAAAYDRLVDHILPQRVSDSKWRGTLASEIMDMRHRAMVAPQTYEIAVVSDARMRAHTEAPQGDPVRVKRFPAESRPNPGELTGLTLTPKSANFSIRLVYDYDQDVLERRLLPWERLIRDALSGFSKQSE